MYRHGGDWPISLILRCYIAKAPFQKCAPHVLLENEAVFAICSTHIGGAPPPAAVPFFTALFDPSLSLSLKDVKFAVLGLGHAEYAENYCKVRAPPRVASCGRVQ